MNKNRQVSVNASPIWKKFAMGTAASAVVVAGLASAANVDPIPTISNTFAVAGEVVKSADINKLAESINLLDVRTNNFKDNITVIDDGKVGIGTATPSAKLEVREENNSIDGSIQAYTNPYGPLITIKDYTNSLNGILQQYNDAPGGPAFLIDSSAGGNNLQLSTDNQARVTIEHTSGNVGIGTTDPTAKLHINDGSIIIDRHFAGPSIVMTNSDNQYYSNIEDNWEIYPSGLGASNTDNPVSRFSITTRSRLDGSQTQPFNIISDTGNVGIGIKDPTAKLEVSSTTNSSIKITDSDSTIEDDSAMSFLEFAGNDGFLGYIGDGSGNRNDIGVYSKKGIRLTAGGGGNTGVDMTIVDSGDIGIGTTDPTAKLQVVGIVEYADNAAAISAGLTAGAFYRTGDLLKIVH